MDSIQVCKKVLAEGAMLIRPRKSAKVVAYDCKELYTGKKKGWMILDSFTASAIMACFNAVNADTQERMKRAPVTKLSAICFQYVS